MNVEIRKGEGIEGLVGSSMVEEVREVEASRGLSEVFERFVRIMDGGIDMMGNHVGVIPEVLTPNQINAFLQQTSLYDDYPYYLVSAGVFVSRLIQNSYDSGNNDFMLSMTDLRDIGYLGYWIVGKRENPLEVTIVGDAGRTCGMRAEHSIITVQGSVGDSCGRNSENSIFNITADTAEYCGFQSNKSTFNITRYAGYHCGAESINSIFNISGDAGDGCGYNSNGSTFKTENKETLHQMLMQVPRGNRIIFMQDGTEEIKRDY